MPAPTHSYARSVVPHHSSSEDDSNGESNFPSRLNQTGTSASSTSNYQRLIKLEKVYIEELTGSCSLFDPKNILGPRRSTGRQHRPHSGTQGSEGGQCGPSDAPCKSSKYTRSRRK